jgi:large subunit ribosomal protein L31e
MGMGFKKCASRVLKEIWKFATKEMGTPEAHVHSLLNKAVWAKGIRNVPIHNHVQFPIHIMRMQLHQTSCILG